MKFAFSQEWLERKLAHCDDSNVAAAGTTFDQFKRDMEQRTVTPPVLSDIPTDLGKVVRFVREQKGWSRADLAQLADIDEGDVDSIETIAEYNPSPRTVIRLADTCHLSRKKFMELAQHRQSTATGNPVLRFAANSGTTSSVSEEEYKAICALIDTLSGLD
jgi:ribosome-binding protein aMBF1 (putative translation factor)